MTDDPDSLFGGRHTRPTFTERVARGAFAPPPDPAPPPAAAADPVPSTEQGYRPFGFMPSNTVGDICEVRGWMAGTDIPEGIVFQYRFLMQVGFSGDTLLKLMLPDCIVVIEGRHLTDLRQKLSRRMVMFIQQHHPKLWPQPPAHEPMIARVEVVRPNK